MSKLEKNYNWNGEYRLIGKLEKTRFKVSDKKYPEYFYIFIEDNNTLRYTIIDDNFGMPALANTMDTEHSLKLRAEAIHILDELEKLNIIEKIECRHSNIVVAHYAYDVKGEIGFRLSCKVFCKDCDNILFKDKNIETVYGFIEENRDKFETLLDMTCDNLNERFKIKE